MEHKTRESILNLIEEEDVEFIRLQFTDMFGTLKNIAVTAGQMEKALDGKCWIEGLAVHGFDKDDMEQLFLYPDLTTFSILPWRPQQGKVARLLCDVCYADGKPVFESSRYILKRVVEEAEKEGYTFFAEPECEFFLFHTDDNGIPTTTTHEKAGYMDLSPLDLGENARRDMVLTLEDMGYDIETSHHEKAPAQHEIDFCSEEGVRLADLIVTFKTAVRTIAKRHGLHATFMPKPRNDAQGSGMHLRFLLRKDGKDVFEENGGLSQEAKYFIGGLKYHAGAMAAITNPIVNSYKRLVPGFGAPLVAGEGQGNESLIHVPHPGKEGYKIEFRLPDAAANPYLTLALCLGAGLDGIKRKLKPEEVYANIPKNLCEAVKRMETDEFVNRILGEAFVKQYAKEKQTEWNAYMNQVTEWEIENYLFRI
ncbi:glutamine synthetase family protein [Lachnoclostridium sp. An181]|uniref:glutamine synthetase family protein n=1 Tax=Lachnoclostridium sp. An181 TaxID=1965575 RepID=UPI000B37039A|nr:glutamine synthetase family protein [Lachnoclostridium sp. An181]OUP50643.1 type I glutamate--ammonia ligase [Lachnoclostridium sp. An181]